MHARPSLTGSQRCLHHLLVNRLTMTSAHVLTVHILPSLLSAVAAMAVMAVMVEVCMIPPRKQMYEMLHHRIHVGL